MSASPTAEVEGSRCDVISTEQFTVAITAGPSSIPANTQVRFTLPSGLTFASGAPQIQNVPITATSSPATVTVPPFQLTGSAGTYSVTAELYSGNTSLNTSGKLTVSAATAAGTLVLMPKQITTGNEAPTYSPTPTGTTNALRGAVSGNHFGSDNAVITAGPGQNHGDVKIWGANYATATEAAPHVLTGPSPTAGWTMVDNYTSNGLTIGTTAATSTYRRRTGGIVANASVVRQWFEDRENSASGFVSREVTGFAGTVRAVAAEDGRSFVLTSEGLYSWVNDVGTNTIELTVADRLSSADATILSTWSEDRRGFGNGTLRVGVLIYPTAGGPGNPPNIATWTFTNNGPATPGSVPAPANITLRKIQASSCGIAALGSDRVLRFRGPGYASGSGSWDATNFSWVSPSTIAGNVAALPRDVVDFDSWGVVSEYNGGLWIAGDGRVGQWHGQKNVGRTITVASDTGQPTFTNITQVYAADGNFMALESTGQVWAWGSNLDRPGYGRPRVVPSGAGTTTDLNIWGLHQQFRPTSETSDVDHFYGGGYVIKGVAVCPLPPT